MWILLVLIVFGLNILSQFNLYSPLFSNYHYHNEYVTIKKRQSESNGKTIF